MSTPEDQHDTVVLNHDTVVLNRHAVVPPSASWDQSPWTRSPGYAAAGWSQVPPFVSPAAAPVIVMHNNAAVIGATLGSVSLFLSLIPIIGIVAWVLAPIGLLTSGIGLTVGMSRRAGRVGAIWGLLTSGAALLVCLAWAALLLAL
jgi:hypothetical protein